MRDILFFFIFLCPFTISAQTFTTSSQGKNNSAGSHYVAPVVTKTYTTPTSTTSPSHYTAPSGSTSSGTYSSGSTSAYYGNNFVLFGGFRERAKRRKNIREWKKKEQAAEVMILAVKEWKAQATAMMSHYKSGNYKEATNIMLAIQPLIPGSGDNSFQKMYNYTCIQLLSEMSEYKAVINLSNAMPEVIDGFPNDFTNCSPAEALLIKSAYIEAVHHESGVAVARSKWKAVDDRYTPYFISREKDDNAISLCYNIVAMRYCQLGLFEEGKSHIRKQLALYQGDEKGQFVIYQNLIPLIDSDPESNTALSDFCIEGIEHLIKETKKKNTDKELLYAISHSKAYLLFLKKQYTAAEAILNAETNPPAAFLFDYNFLKLQVLNELSEIESKIDVRTEITKRHQKRWDDAITPAHKASHDSLRNTGYYDSLDREYINHSDDKSIEESKVYTLLVTDTTLNIDVRNDLGNKLSIYGAEEQLRYKNYESAKVLFNSLTFGNEADAWRYLIRVAQINVLEGNIKEAISVLKKTINDFDGVYEPYLALAEIYRNNTQEPKKAKENYLLAYDNGAFLSDEVMLYLDGK